MRKFRILLLLPDLPLPFASAASRWYCCLLRGLVARGHSVTAFVAGGSSSQQEVLREFFPGKQYDIRFFSYSRFSQGLWGKIRSFREPYGYIWSGDMKCSFEKEVTSPYDVIHVEQLWSAWPVVKYANKAIVNVHFSFVLDQAFSFPASLENRVRGYMTCRAERELLQSFPRITAITDDLTRYVSRVNPRADVRRVVFGMDTALYDFPSDIPNRQCLKVGLVGSFHWWPSYSAGKNLLERLWPGIKERVPSACLKIVGHSARSAFGDYLGLPDVEILQDVEDIGPHFQDIDVLVYAPDCGSGVKVKILEAFAFGVPVVTNRHGVEGMALCEGQEAMVCNTDKDIIEHVVRLLKDLSERQRIRRDARRFVEGDFAPDRAIGLFEKIYADFS